MHGVRISQAKGLRVAQRLAYGQPNTESNVSFRRNSCAIRFYPVSGKAPGSDCGKPMIQHVVERVRKPRLSRAW